MVSTAQAINGVPALRCEAVDAVRHGLMHMPCRVRGSQEHRGGSAFQEEDDLCCIGL
jgi:hypothetical protein